MLALCFAAYVAVLALLAVYALHRLYLVVQYWRLRPGPEPAPPLPEPLPVVTVQIPLFNERYVAERVIDAAAALSWPADRLEIQVLDDSTDETRTLCRHKVDELRRRGLDAVHLHRTRRDGFKAGALKEGLARARGELVLVLDADFVPQPDLLRRTVGFFADPACAMVQVRWEHLNRRFSVLTRVQALLLDGHFVVEQAVRCRLGRFFNFNGTAGVWRRRAIDDAGGWHADTLTEDLDLSYRALLRGWRFRYLLADSAPAELPVDMNAFKSQQFRWAKGSVQVGRKLLPAILRSDLPRAVKIESFFHLTQNVPYLITVFLALFAVPVLALRSGPAFGASALDAALAVGTTGTLALYCATSQRALRRSGGFVGALAAVPALIAVTAGMCVSQGRAVLEAAAGHASEFVRTPKLGITRARQGWRHRRYRGARTVTAVAELALCAYFGAGLAVAGADGRWLVLPILAVFALGFAYVGGRSLAGR